MQPDMLSSRSPTGNTATGGVNLDIAADSVTVDIKDASGQVVRELQLAAKEKRVEDAFSLLRTLCGMATGERWPYVAAMTALSLLGWSVEIAMLLMFQRAFGLEPSLGTALLTLVNLDRFNAAFRIGSAGCAWRVRGGRDRERGVGPIS